MLRNRRLLYPALVLSVLAATTLVAPAQTVSSFRAPCDQTDKALCLLPFPNDLFTTPDSSTATGRRVDFQLLEMPRSVVGKPIDPTEWNRNDGFSPGSEVLTFVPGLDLHRTWGTQNMTGARVGGPNDPRDNIADIGRYTEPDAPILLIDATTGKRWPFWSELDMNAGTAANKRVLIVRPAVNLTEGHRYLVALRNMKNASGATIPADAQFAAYRDNTASTDPTFVETRRAHVNSVIAQIQTDEVARGISFDRSKLYLAWDFTVASERNLSERVLHIRDDAFAQLGDTNLADGVIQGVSPRYKITTVTPQTGTTARLVEGTITVPNYLGLPPMPVPGDKVSLPTSVPGLGDTLPGQAIPGGRFLYGADGLPMQNPVTPTIDVPFNCYVPATATAADPAYATLYGHGLLGSRDEAGGSSTQRDREHNLMTCAVDWMGLSEHDIGNAVVTLADPSNFASVADRVQQGFVNFLYLGRALKHAQGLATNAAFQDASHAPLFRTGTLFYDGNSQGGIMGGALTALGVDFTRSVLGVTGMNYSTLLNRSVDWEGALVDPSNPGIPAYSSILYTMFPDKIEEQLVLALMQMQWDRAEADGYAEHMTTDPYPNTPAHQVLMHVALGDFQVSNFAAEVEARTIGARVMDSALMPGRSWELHPFWGLTPIPRDASGNILPWDGSALVFWDVGNLLPPNANIPPSTQGGDPHGDPRKTPKGIDQKMIFWLTGQIVDVMNGGPYLACVPGEESQIPRVPSQFTFDWCK